jgi:lipoprotein-anchoring transpeptidase ErfK/SrfK
VKRSLLIGLIFVFGLPLAAADLRLDVDLSERRIVAIVDGEEAASYDVSIGKDPYPTPRGDFSIRKVVWNPSWKPPDSKWARGKSAKGPADPDNPMKRVKMFFKEPDYYIHGTGDVDSLGQAKSHGCLRMHEEDVTDLAKLVMEHGGKPMPEPWYKRILHRRTTKVIYLSDPIPVEIRE